MTTKLQANQINEIIANLGYPCQGRLTLTSGTPVTTSDVTAATTVYFTPYNGDHISLYDGSNWNPYTFTELSLSLSGYTADSNYDIFIYDNSGTLTLESLIWSDATTRATGLTTQNGVYVKSGATTRRYLGTIRITSTTGQCEDSETKRYVWNYYNQAEKKLYKAETYAGGWTYASVTPRYVRNDSTNKVEFVMGIQNNTISISLVYNGKINSSSYYYDIDLYLDTSGVKQALGYSTVNEVSISKWDGTPSIGYHYFAMYELTSSASGTLTGNGWSQCYLMGVIKC